MDRGFTGQKIRGITLSLASFFNFAKDANPQSTELPEIFPFYFTCRDFVEIDILNIYSRILTDVLERTQGMKESYMPTLWDNCIASESSDGLVTLLAKAMRDKSDLFLVYNPALNLLRRADSLEQAKISKDYAAQGSSVDGVYISFKNYRRTDMIKLYSQIEHSSIASLFKTMKLSSAIQIKIKDMRGSIALPDSSVAIEQAASMAKGLAKGLDVAMDADDNIVTALPDATPVEKSMAFIDKKRAFYLGMPASYLTGSSNKGLGDSGDGEARAIERGLKNYFFSIVKPTLEAIFNITVTFESEDNEDLMSALNVLKSFELTDERFISEKNKLMLINQAFGLPDNSKGDPIPEPTPGPAPAPAPVE